MACHDRWPATAARAVRRSHVPSPHPAGHHVIELHYWPTLFTVGLIVAGIAVLLIVSSFVIAWAIRRMGSSRPGIADLAGDSEGPPRASRVPDVSTYSCLIHGADRVKSPDCRIIEDFAIADERTIQGGSQTSYRLAEDLISFPMTTRSTAPTDRSTLSERSRTTESAKPSLVAHSS